MKPAPTLLLCLAFCALTQGAAAVNPLSAPASETLSAGNPAAASAPLPAASAVPPPSAAAGSPASAPVPVPHPAESAAATLQETLSAGNPAATSVPLPAESAAAPPPKTLSDEVAALQKRVSTWERVLSRLPEISGYVQTGFEWSERRSTFFLKRVRLNLRGDIAPKIDYRVQVEWCTPRIVDAYLRYRPFGALNFQLGAYKLPFSIENTEYVPLRYEFIEYPLSLRKLMGFSDLCGLSATGRDLGAMLFGGFFRREGYDLIGYNVGVFNGEGLQTKDANRSKDLCARLTIRPVAGLQIAGSYYWGEYGADYRKRIRYGAGVCYDRGPVVLRGEYICGTTGMTAGEGTAAYELDSEGWYAVAAWRVTPTLQPALRCDTFRESASSASRQTNYTAALKWQPVKYLCCQLDYTYEHYAARGVSDRNVVAVMLTGIF